MSLARVLCIEIGESHVGCAILVTTTGFVCTVLDRMLT